MGKAIDMLYKDASILGAVKDVGTKLWNHPITTSVKKTINGIENPTFKKGLKFAKEHPAGAGLAAGGVAGLGVHSLLFGGNKSSNVNVNVSPYPTMNPSM
jgi:hypothetical protein